MGSAQPADEVVDGAVRAPWPDHVGKAEHPGPEIETVGEDGKEGLGGQLRGAVERDRLQRTRGFAERLPRIAEHGRRAGEEQPPDGVPVHGLQDGQRRREGQSQVQGVVLAAAGDVGIGGQVENRVESGLGEQPVQGLPFQHVELAEVEPLVTLQVLDVFDPAQVEVIDAPDFLAALDERVAEVAADESRPAGD